MSEVTDKEDRRWSVVDGAIEDGDLLVKSVEFENRTVDLGGEYTPEEVDDVLLDKLVDEINELSEERIRNLTLITPDDVEGVDPESQKFTVLNIICQSFPTTASRVARIHGDMSSKSVRSAVANLKADDLIAAIGTDGKQHLYAPTHLGIKEAFEVGRTVSVLDDGGLEYDDGKEGFASGFQSTLETEPEGEQSEE